jgi:CheY-like chemotaxis protein
LAALRAALIREFEHVAAGKGVGYTVDIRPGTPPGLVTDPQRLQQILKNLLANAFKFTEPGEVHVQMSVARHGWSSDLDTLGTAPAVLAISVADTGIGIDEQQQQRIFEAFAQGDGTTARLYGGTGLGLSISRALVALLGGEITLTSILGQGSSFSVYLPLVPALEWQTPVGGSSVPAPRPEGLPAAEPRAAEEGPKGPTVPRNPGLDEYPFAKAKVLIVDDDFRNIFALSALLERGRAEVSVAESGEEAVALVRAGAGVDVILMDIMMPGMDGYATIRAIRALPDMASLPIVAVTGKVVAGERQRCIDAGANDYVPKPVNSVELIAAIAPWLTTSEEAA